MGRFFRYVMVIFIVAAIATPFAFAQSEESKAPAAKEDVSKAASPQEAAAPAAMPEKEEAPKISELSIYGEVQAVNVQANSMTVQYYDYDNDEEKTTEITLDGNSKLENAKAIGDIKKGDWVDVTYTAIAGKNTAKLVSVEKEEPAQEENAPAVNE